MGHVAHLDVTKARRGYQRRLVSNIMAVESLFQPGILKQKVRILNTLRDVGSFFVVSLFQRGILAKCKMTPHFVGLSLWIFFGRCSPYPCKDRVWSQSLPCNIMSI